MKLPVRLRAASLVTLLASAILLAPVEAQLPQNSLGSIGWLGSGANNTYALAVGDLNDDGFPDVVVESQRFNDPVDVHTGVGVFLNNGTGGFGPGVRYATDGFSAAPQSVKIADMNGDGHPDLVVLNAGTSCTPVCSPAQSVSVMRGNGDGTFQPAVSAFVNIYPNTTVSPNKLTVADVNGDGKPDVLVADGASYAPFAFNDNFRGAVSVLLNHGDGTFATPVLYDSGGYLGAADIVAADTNGDGIPDIVVANACSIVGGAPSPGYLCTDGNGTRIPGTVGVLLGNGNGTFQQARTYASGGVAPGSLAAADLNHDGRIDLLVTNAACFQCTGHAVSVLMGNGDGSFQAPVNYNDGATQPVSVAAGDVDGDGLVDVAVMNFCALNLGCDGSTGTLSVMLGTGDGTLQAPALYDLWSTAAGDIPNTVVLSDLNKDGKPDVVVGAWTAFGFLLNQTPRASTTTAILSQSNPSGFGQPVLFTATVSSAHPGTPTGTITFSDGAMTLGSAPLVGGAATLSASGLALGAHRVVASYSSDSAFRASVSAPLTQVVAATTTTALAAAPNPAALQEPVTLTATVATEFGATPTGSVTFKDGSGVLGTAPLSGHTAAFSTSSLTAGAHLISAVYGGDAGNLGSASIQVLVSILPSGPAATMAFHGVGDLPGGPTVSQMRDATRVGNTIYAVGASAAHIQPLCTGPNTPPGCVAQFNSDTSALWTWDGTSATLTALPDLVTPNVPGASAISAAAITRDGLYIASQARSSVTIPGFTQPVRIPRNTLVPLNLGAAPFPALVPSAAAPSAISDDGTVVYASAGAPGRAVRIDVASSSSALIPLLSTSDTSSFVAGRGASSDGSVAVGTSFVAPFTGINGRAFRYVHGAGGDTVAPIPLLNGGTWNKAIAVSPDGRLVLAAGDSTFLPNGEMYLDDTATGTITPLGSPNTPWGATTLGGMTADGSAVIVTFLDVTTPNGIRTAYLRNAHGWFHLTTVLASQGIDIQSLGWSDEGSQAAGVSPDGTLVFGSGTHDGNTEGFVAEFPPGLLANFDVPAIAPADTSIVGLWQVAGSSQQVIAFLKDGTYVQIDTSEGTQVTAEYTSGFERGRYTANPATGQATFATLQDTNGSVGLSGLNGFLGFTGTVSGDTLTGSGGAVLTRVTGGHGSVVGGWSFGDPFVDNRTGVLVLLADQTYLLAEHGDSAIDPSGHDGIESGVYTWTPASGLTVNVMLDTNGGWGLSNGVAQVVRPWQPSADDLILGPPGPHQLSRIVDPQAVVPAITSALTASGRVGTPFTYTAAGNFTSRVDATGLPGGLAIDPPTGVISGTPTTAGAFPVLLSASNSLGLTSSATLVITVDPQFAATSVSVSPASGTYGATTTVSATLASGGGPLPGRLISFALNGTPVGSATTNAAGVATLSNASLAGAPAGAYPVGVQAAFGGDATYAPSSGSAALTVTKATPQITWPAPADIVHGTALGAAQLNAAANVPGGFAYAPPAGTILPVGSAEPLAVIFTPTDAANYASAQASVSITVVGAAPVARSVAVTTEEGTTQSGTLLATDGDGVGVTFSIVTPPVHGTVVLLDVQTGAFTYTPNAGTFGYEPFTFRAAAPSGASTVATGMAFTVAASPHWPGQTIRASVSSGGSQISGAGTTGIDGTFAPALSADGRSVAFYSLAANVVAGDTNNVCDVFVIDRTSGAVTPASVSSTGVQANSDSCSDGLSMSADGRFVAFASYASNLVVGDTNGAEDIFVYDRQTGTTARASAASDGTQANGNSILPSLSADGRYVTFESAASNLVAGDTNGTHDVFVHDMQTGQTVRASVASNGAQAAGDSLNPAISADGRFVAFSSNGSNLAAGGISGGLDLFVHDMITGTTTRVSVSTGGTPGNDVSLQPALSADGRYVAFASNATNLVPGDTNAAEDVFVHDMQTGQTSRVSVSSTGLQADSHSFAPSLSADGRYVAFASVAANLVPGDTNGAYDAFVYDRQTGQTSRISVGNDGAQGNGISYYPGFSADARYIGFDSSASNLVAADTNNQFDVFVTGGVTVSPRAVSVPNGGGTRSVTVTFDNPGTPWSATTTTPWITINSPNGGSASGALSFTVAPNSGAARSGTLTVALQTVTVEQDAATAPVAQSGAVTTNEDIPVHGALTASDPNGDPLTFSIVTAPARGTVVIDNPATGAFTYTPSANLFGGDSFTFQASDGHEASNIATMSVTVTPVNDAPATFDSALQVVEDTATSGFFSAADADSLLVTFSIVTPPSHGTVTIPQPLGSPFGTSFTYTPNANYNGADSFSFHASDGSLTSNTATVSITVTPVNDPPVAASIVITTEEDAAKAGTLAATDVDGDPLTFSIVTPPAMGTLALDAATGAFTYTPNAGALGYDTFIFRAADPSGASSTANGQIFIVAKTPRWPGQTVRVDVSSGGTQSNGSVDDLSPPAFSADGRFIAFSSLASNLVAGDTNGAYDVFVFDRNTAALARSSLSSAGAQGNNSSGAVRSISADGRFVAFSSSATNLVAGDTNGAQDIFVRDILTGTTARVSVASDGAQGNADSSASWISADGRFVAFVSTASNLVAGDTNGKDDVFVRDLQTGQTVRASVASDGTQGDGDSSQPVMSADGRFVAFRSSATNLVAGDTNGAFDVFVRDLVAGTTSRVSVASDGTQANNQSLNPMLSADGRYVAFASSASNLVPGDTNGTFDVFVRDLQTGQTARASVATGGVEANGAAPALSADGRYVAFSSAATNLAPGDGNGVSDVFVFDRQTAQTTRVSVAGDGSEANSVSLLPSFSGDSRYIGFFSQATNFVTGDTNNALDLFVVGGVLVSPTAINVPAAGGSPAVSVAFDHPGTPWSATTTAPWITINPPAGSSASGTLSFTVAANFGAARTATLAVATQTVTVTQDAAPPDTTPPAVTAPAPITVFATVPAGATSATVPALAAFLAGATATDDRPGAPAAQPPTLNGAAVTSSTLFALGSNTVTFAFTDVAGNIGTATSDVTVTGGGRPALSVSLVGITVAGPGQQTVALKLTNTGTANAENVNVALSSLRTLAGTGTVTVASGLPVATALLAPGQTLNMPILVNVPATVLRFALALTLTTTDYTGAVLSSASTQTIFPIDVTPPTVPNNGPALAPARTSITVTWQTSEAATGGVAYGIGTSTNLTVPDDGVFAASHTATLTGLVPNTTYSVIVTGHDPAGNVYNSVRKTVKTNP